MSCPICGRATDAKLRPFCSKRCADIDLAKWMSGSYAIPSTDPEDVEEAIEAAEKARQEDTKH
ncbi:DNA gyrase inhibitor YacG [Salipiger abyssi]|uniref:DNA gyrase inhibitor YacG n=1 Tax=Salipiger abyssi TaxID=1250539 RepID=UPI001A8F98F1|nr:DNA gyrase inhibitor YacG [Salipiger abyssi]MBN9888501.1 DNA gyrase inhibitor YacG [Salipiger abyssi]